MAEANQKPQGTGGTEQSKQQAQPSTEISKDARMWAMLCHLLGFFTCFIGPLIIWLIKKDEDPFIDNQGKEALNFQITVAIAWDCVRPAGNYLYRSLLGNCGLDCGPSLLHHCFGKGKQRRGVSISGKYKVHQIKNRTHRVCDYTSIILRYIRFEGLSLAKPVAAGYHSLNGSEIAQGKCRPKPCGGQ